MERVERTINGASARRRESYESRIAPHSGRTVDLDACGGLRGASILSLLVGDPAYAHNQLRQDLWRAGHAHAGVLLILSLVTLRYVDEANLSKSMKRVVRHSIPAAAILLPMAFFLSVLSPRATEPNALIYLAYLGALSLAAGLLLLSIGLIRSGPTVRDAKGAARAERGGR